VAQANLGHELLKPIAVGRLGARVRLILVDDVDVLGRPAQVTGALREVVLACGAPTMVTDLRERRLPHVDPGGPGKVVRP